MSHFGNPRLPPPPVDSPPKPPPVGVRFPHARTHPYDQTPRVHPHPAADRHRHHRRARWAPHARRRRGCSWSSWHAPARGGAGQIDATGHTVEWSVAHPLPRVDADPTTLHSVLRNLVRNALKYTRDRDPARIELMAREGPTEVVFTVRDNGVGFDMKYADKSFGVSRRLHRPEDFPGTGIGLASVKRVIERPRGRAGRSAGEGATSCFSLPTRKVPGGVAKVRP